MENFSHSFRTAFDKLFEGSIHGSLKDQSTVLKAVLRNNHSSGYRTVQSNLLL